MIRYVEHVAIYSGLQDESRSVVGLLMKRRSAQTLQSFWPVSDRVILAKFARKPLDIVVIQVHALMLESDDENIDACYADLKSALQKCKNEKEISTAQLSED